MADTNTMIMQALEHYDKVNEKNTHVTSGAVYYKFSGRDKPNDHNITLYDKDKNIILKATYDVIGAYHSNHNLWIWGWADPSMRKVTVQTSRKILMYGIDQHPHDNPALKSELITSRFHITNRLQLDIHVALASYIGKQDIIYEVRMQPGAESVDGLNKLYTGDTEYVSYYISLMDISK